MFTTQATVLFTLLTSLASAAPGISTRQTTPDIFVGVALHSGDSKIHLRAINANGGSFLINKASSAYCPDIENLDCSTLSNSTTFSGSSSSSTLSLSVIVPGGQQIYVLPSGALSYTAPHSTYTPTGSNTTGFQYTPATTTGSVGNLQYNDNDWYACPTGETGTDGGDVYQIYAASLYAYGNSSLCEGFAFGTSVVESTGAFEF